MPRHALWLAALCAAPPLAAQSAPQADKPAAIPQAAPSAMSAIDRVDLKAHASLLASDEFGGRYTGSTGQIAAAEYIAARFEKLGLRPLGDKQGGSRSFFQRYPVERTYLDPKRTSVKFGQAVLRHFAVVPGRSGDTVSVRGTVVDCGDGSPDEIPKTTLRGRIPLVLIEEPKAGPRARMLSMRTAQRAESINRELARRGAAVAVFCLSAESSSLADAMNTGALLPDKPLLAFDNNRGRRFSPHKIPSVFIGGEDGRRLREALGRGDGKRNKVRGSVQLAVGVDKRAHAMNVVACREGVDRKLNKEAVVFSAHMDHMGTRLDGDAFNGADDNASGTAGLLEIAEAFATEAPKRSIVFLSVSGEELGLWGSEYFADHATWPLARIVADINIDMIGRSTVLAGENAISVTPSHRHNQYSTLVRNAAHLAPEFELGLTIGDTYYQRSDHYNFARKGIPVVFFCDGEHEDYHKVTDHADKLDYAKMERVTRLAFWTGWMAAEAKHRPKRLGSQAGW